MRLISRLAHTFNDARERADTIIAAVSLVILDCSVRQINDDRREFLREFLSDRRRRRRRRRVLEYREYRAFPLSIATPSRILVFSSLASGRGKRSSFAP